MAINWFPGHMHKARKEIKKVMSDVDVVIELLDARIPFSSSNPLVGNLRGEKPVIKLLNKADLADPKVTEAWQAHLEKDNAVKSLALSATADGKIKMIANLCRKLAPHKVDSDKGISAMIMGIPNVGKSTLINSLAGKTIAKVGNEPAVTKRQQKIKLDNGITLSDTPGILWPKLEPATCGYRLASTGAVKDTAMEYEDVAWECLKEFRVLYPNALKDRYGLSEFGSDEYELLEFIGKKRGCLKSGGVVDVHQAATIFLQDLRSGKLGRVTLETPKMMEAEMAEFRAMLEAKREQEELAKKEKEDRSGKRTS
ncbi:ribosome biogenesis GTPase YlqF [Oleiphilus sp. HI0125]|uniref:ribosome biogenesis GTPase YlqF n=1 Tax=Oleiphilus sp. HI0125 TaxID=1822266 RepID=UPI0007C2E8A7|nr:ribosome biogenesis GTPase YlqF [Oleiphilus sp. HI0125]KZZ57821.1 ribosome biogenesis GTPase YlqF [Oleiphilus sp. HI0125]